MKKIILTALMLILWTSIPVFSEPIVVVNNDVAVSSVSSDSIAKIYLGKLSKWDNGQMIVPVTLEGGTVHDSFLKDFVKKSDSQFSAYWKKMVFTGQGVPPKSVSSEAEMVKLISGTSGGIGYIDSATPHDGVKVVSIK